MTVHHCAIMNDDQYFETLTKSRARKKLEFQLALGTSSSKILLALGKP